MPAFVCGNKRGHVRIQTILKIKLNSQLNVSRISRAGDNTERRIGLDEAGRKAPRGRCWIGSESGGCSWIQVLRMVKQVENLKTELKVFRLREAKVLEDGHVPIVDPRPTHQTTSRRPIGSESRSKRRGVEPLGKTAGTVRVAN